MFLNCEEMPIVSIPTAHLSSSEKIRSFGNLFLKFVSVFSGNTSVDAFESK